MRKFISAKRSNTLKETGRFEAEASANAELTGPNSSRAQAEPGDTEANLQRPERGNSEDEEMVPENVPQIF